MDGVRWTCAVACLAAKNWLWTFSAVDHVFVRIERVRCDRPVERDHRLALVAAVPGDLF